MSKEKIIAASVEIFSENGYHKANMDEIALRANVAKGTIYYHFPSKSDLFKSLIVGGFQNITNKIQKELRADLTLEEQIKNIVKHNLDLFLEESSFAHIVFNEISNGIDQDVLNEFKTIRLSYINLLTNILEDAQKEGLLENVNCKLASIGILGLLQSTCNYYINNSNEFSRTDIDEFIFNIINTGLFLKARE